MSEAERRRKLLQMAAGAAFLALAVVLVLIVVNAADSGSGGDVELEEAAAANRVFTGIPQDGMTLGDPQAPVRLSEYGDLQCPVCRAYSEEVLPPIIESRVKKGQVSITFHNFVIIGPESVPAGTAALAAGNQGRGWNFVEVFYRNQGEERSGYVTEEFIEAVGRAAKIKDFARWNRERKSKALEEVVEASGQEAEGFGFNGTPSFVIEGPQTQGPEALGFPESRGALEEAIEAAG
jgi:protein-disulfide isomerase